MVGQTDRATYQIWQGKEGNFTRFINHSCEPNSQFERFIWLGKQRIVLVSKGIEAGEEVTVDYGETYWEVSSTLRCDQTSVINPSWSRTDVFFLLEPRQSMQMQRTQLPLPRPKPQQQSPSRPQARSRGRRLEQIRQIDQITNWLRLPRERHTTQRYARVRAPWASACDVQRSFAHTHHSSLSSLGC